MPRGCLSSVLQDVTADGTAWPSWGGAQRASCHGVALGDDAAHWPLMPPQLPRRLRHGAHLGASFMAAAGSEDAAAEAEKTAVGGAGSEDAAAEAEKTAMGGVQEGKDDPYPAWANTAGLPTVTLTSRSDKYFSPDIADAAGDGSFKPIFGCKCGDWQPASTHPMIEFRDSYIQSHPNFTKQLKKLKVHMEDTTVGKVQWDATYDVKRFLTPEDLAKAYVPGGKVKLKDTIPADKGTGQQIRFMTFCPPEANAGDENHAPGTTIPHEYLMKVTALDADEQPIDGFVDDESRYSAAAAEPEQPPGPETVPGSAFADGKIVGTAKIAES